VASFLLFKYSKAGLNPNDTYSSHQAHVTSLHFHPNSGSANFSSLFLTSSLDWSIKLWSAENLNKPSTAPKVLSPLTSFEEADDAVFDVRWSPVHPAIFSSVDGSGQFSVFNLNSDLEVLKNYFFFPIKNVLIV